MASSPAPMRLNKDLVDKATREAGLHYRTPPKQIELWAELGRIVESQISAEDRLALAQGLLRIKLEPYRIDPISSDEVWEDVENDRRRGTMAEATNQGQVSYQASNEHPGWLEAVYPDGHIEVGQFENGRFVKRNEGHAA